MTRFVLAGALGLASVPFLAAQGTLAPPTAGSGPASRGEQGGQPALDLAREYLGGLEVGALDEMDHLFLPDQRSTIMENASDEGSWEHYREHHLAPEHEAAPNFRFEVEKEAVEQFGSAYVVRQTGRFTVGAGEAAPGFRAAITYVMTEESSALRIAHLHWSSRPERPR